MQKFFYKLARWVRPIQALPLPSELADFEFSVSQYDEQAMLRDAKCSQFSRIPIGVFEVVGIEHVERAIRAWRPRELFLMLVLSKAFDVVEQQCQRGILIEPHDRDRLAEILNLYLQFQRVRKCRETARDAVERYISEHSLSDAVSASVAARPIVIRHPLLNELRQVDAELRERFPSSDHWDVGLMALGLKIAEQTQIQGDEGRYGFCTPINCRVFADTGGNGVHFSLLVQNGEITPDSPVVKTSPGNCGMSLIVGENLFDFLCLGLRRGYFALEQLHPDNSESLDAYTDSDWQPSTESHAWVGYCVTEHHQRMLDYIATRLTLHPWTDRQRLEMLQEKYRPELRLPPEMRNWK